MGTILKFSLKLGDHRGRLIKRKTDTWLRKENSWERLRNTNWGELSLSAKQKNWKEGYYW